WPILPREVDLIFKIQNEPLTVPSRPCNSSRCTLCKFYISEHVYTYTYALQKVYTHSSPIAGTEHIPEHKIVCYVSLVSQELNNIYTSWYMAHLHEYTSVVHLHAG